MQNLSNFDAVDFFAGSGLVTEGLSDRFQMLWANDNCQRKKRVYTANFGDAHFEEKSIIEVDGASIPQSHLSWASFPCQDLSLAGNMAGIERGDRSALFWQWIRILDEMAPQSRPPVICLENVVGFLVIQNSSQFGLAYDALRERGYVAGAFVLDACHFTPQSRPRSFIVAVREDISVETLTTPAPLPYIHNKAVMRAFAAVNDPSWKWWKLPLPPLRTKSFTDICERDAPSDPEDKVARNISLVPPAHIAKLHAAIARDEFIAGTGYKRMRKDSEGVKRQCLEIRFDGLAGCLRTPRGGSSRQFVFLVDDGKIRTRLLTIREAARLMGVRNSYVFPGTYNDAYLALGDAVAVPVTRYISHHLLHPLCVSVQNQTVALGA